MYNHLLKEISRILININNNLNKLFTRKKLLFYIYKQIINIYGCQ